jgi:hypothetical protein
MSVFLRSSIRLFGSSLLSVIVSFLTGSKVIGNSSKYFRRFKGAIASIKRRMNKFFSEASENCTEKNVRRMHRSVEYINTGSTTSRKLLSLIRFHIVTQSV